MKHSNVFILTFIILLCFSFQLTAQNSNLDSKEIVNIQTKAFMEFEEIKTISSQLAIDVANALDFDPTQTNPQLSGTDLSKQVKILDGLGGFLPVAGNTCVLISTGIAGAGTNGLPWPNPGTKLSSGLYPYDYAGIEFNFKVPPGCNSVSVFVNMFTTEYRGTHHEQLSIGLQSLSSPNSFPKVEYLNAAGIGSSSALNSNYLRGTGFEFGGRTTGFREYSFSVSPGGEYVLYFSLGETGDGLMDTAVLIDNIHFGTGVIYDGIQKSINFYPNSIEMIAGESKNLLIGIPDIAPAGGVKISLWNYNSGIVSISHDEVFIPEGGRDASQVVVCTSNGIEGKTKLMAIAQGYNITYNNVFVGGDLILNKEDITLTNENGTNKLNVKYHNKDNKPVSTKLLINEIDLDMHGGTSQFPKYFDVTVPANGSDITSIEYYPVSLNTKIEATIDPGNSVYERNEKNNQAQKQFGFVEQMPAVNTVWAKYDGNPDPNIIGRFASSQGINGNSSITNTFYASLSGSFLKKVIFDFNGIVVEDADVTDGWSVNFDVGRLPPGTSILKVTAVNINGIKSVPLSKKIINFGWEDWIKTFLEVKKDFTFSSDGKFILCKFRPKLFDFLNFNVGLQNGGPIGGGISGRENFVYDLTIPLDGSVMKADISGGYDLSFLGKLLQIKSGGTLLLNDGKLTGAKINGSFKGRILELGWDRADTTDLFLTKLIIGSGLKFYAFAESDLQVIFNYDPEHNKLTFPRYGSDVSYIKPGLGIGMEAHLLFEMFSIRFSPKLSAEAAISVQVEYATETGLGISGPYGRLELVFTYAGKEVQIYRWDFGPSNSLQIKRNDLENISSNIPEILPFPSMTSDLGGNIMVAWLEESNNSEGIANIYYSVKPPDSPFSETKQIINNPFDKSNVQISYNPDGTANMLWAQNSRSFSGAELDEIQEILKYQDIYYSYWNKSDWSEPVLITPENEGFEKSDGVPSMAVSNDGQEKLILWTRDKIGNLIESQGTEIFYSHISENSLGEMKPVTENNETDYMVRGCFNNDSTAIAVWLNDKDGLIETAKDLQFKYSIWNKDTWSEPGFVTNNSNLKRDLSVAALKNGDIIAVWVEIIELPDSSSVQSLITSTYYHALNTWSDSEIVLSSDHLIMESIVKVDSRNIATITFRGLEEDLTGDVQITTKNYNTPGSNWKSPTTITKDNLADWMIATTIDANNNQYFVNFKSLPSDSSATPTVKKGLSNFYGGLTMNSRSISTTGDISNSLNLGSYNLVPDLKVNPESFIFDEPSLRDGVMSSVFVNVANIGAVASDETTVKIYNNFSQSGGVLLETLNLPVIQPDSSYLLEFNHIFGQSNELRVVVDPENSVTEQSENNNTAEKSLILRPDPVISSFTSSFARGVKIGDNGTLSAKIKNPGQTGASNLTVKFYQNTVNNLGSASMISEQSILSLNFDDSTMVMETCTISNATRNYFWIQIDPDNSISELNETNNQDSLTITVLPDLTIENMSYDNDIGQNKLSVTLRNIGGGDAGNFKMYFYSDDPLDKGTLKDSLEIADLKADTSIALEIEYVSRVGAELIYIWLDRDNQVSELSEENNLHFLIVNRPGSVDVIPSIITERTNYPIGIEYPINVKIKNQGTVGCASVNYKLYDNFGNLIAEDVVSAISPGDSLVEQVNINLTDKSDTLSLILDEEYLLIESNKINNNTTSIINGFEVVRDEIILNPGWSMISSNIDPLFSKIDQVIGTNDSSFIVIRDGNGNIYNPSSNINTLVEWEKEKGYQIYMSQVDSIGMLGEKVNPVNSSISLSTGWNLVSYLRNTQMNIETCLNGIVDDLIIVKNGLGKIFWPEYEINTIGQMNPGEGYQLYVDEDVVLTYPQNDTPDKMPQKNFKSGNQR
jgi:subtilase family serine protease